MVDDTKPGGAVWRAAPGASTQPGGHALGPTLPGDGATSSADTLIPSDAAAPVAALLTPPGYQLRELIGKGGMGEVMAAYDARIGRDVAIKRMRSATPTPDQLARFLREARIQARLDHPAIVPVHELGTDAAGRPFFSMKRVSGQTLGERMAAGSSPQALLRAFVDVCRAVDLAHSRAVIHRDLKPANIMMGDYGEVYVLDWGVARVLTETSRSSSTDIMTLDEGTQTGALLGTPGYMSPEQIRGEPVTQPADVYALGAILFELLAGEALHPRGTAALAATLMNPQEAPSRRSSERPIAPELDAICEAALAAAPAARPTARQLADRVQAYLDGDRDLDQRRRLAGEHLATAQAALATGGHTGRATAIHLAGRALALDPSSAAAAELVTRLIVEPPPELPAALVTELAEQEKVQVRQRALAGLWAYLGLFAFCPLIPFLGVKSWGWVLAMFGVLCGLSLFTWRAARTGRYSLLFGLVGNTVLAVVWTRLAGIYLLTPVFLCGVLLAMTTTAWMIRNRWAVIAWTVLVFLVPLGLEEVGLLMTSIEVTPGAILSRSTMFEMNSVRGGLALLLGNVVFVSMFGLVAVRIHGSAKQAKRRLHIQNWHMNHLLPGSSRGTTA